MEGNENTNQNLKTNSEAPMDIPKEAPQKIDPERPTPPPAPIEKKKEFLARSEVRTMARDLSNTREREAKKELERIAHLNVGPVQKPQIKTNQQDEQEAKEIIKTGVLPPKGYKRPSSFKKIMTRIIALLILLAAAGFIYWFLEIRIQEDSTLEQEVQEQSEETVVEKPIPELSIISNFADWGYIVPETPRTIDTIVLISMYNDTDEDYYNTDKILTTLKDNNALIHYMISRTGEVFQLAPDEVIAYHSGNAQMPDGTRSKQLNLYSLGIAMIYTKDESPNDIQLQQLKSLVSLLREEYMIPIENIFTRQDISLTGATTWNFDKETFINSLTQ
jgi:hypothetical protein